MIGIVRRLKMAFDVFRLKEFEVVIEPYKEVDKLKSGLKCGLTCDNHFDWKTGCKNNAAICMSRGIATFVIEHEDHAHVCNDCKKVLEGTTDDFR